jgi:regulator of RNase E activity RraA
MVTPTTRRYGAIPADRIRTESPPRPSPRVRDRFLALPDTTCAVADALDVLGTGGVIAARTITPLADGARACGPAVTLRAMPYGGDLAAHRARQAPTLLGDRDLYGIAEPGDVAVLAAGADPRAAVIGELSAAWAGLAGVAGVLVDGLVRDVEALRAQPVPVWSRGATPVSARYRLETVELNGPVSFAGIAVRPGDLVVADGNGVAVVPLEAVDAVLAECERAASAEQPLADALAAVGSLEELIARLGQGKEIR